MNAKTPATPAPSARVTVPSTLGRRTLSKRTFTGIAARGDIRGAVDENMACIPKSLWTRYDLPLPATKEEIEAFFSSSEWQFFGAPRETSRASSLVQTDVSPCDMLLSGIGFIMTVSTELSGVTGIGFDAPTSEIATPATDGIVPVTGILPAFTNAGAVAADLVNVNPACAEFGRAAQQAAVAFARSRRAEFIIGCEDFTPMSEMISDIGLITDDPQYSGMGPYVACLHEDIREMNDRYGVVAASFGTTQRVFVPQTSQTIGVDTIALPPPTATRALVGQKLCGNFGGFFPLQNKFVLHQGMPIQLNLLQEEGTQYWQQKLIEAVSAMSAITYAAQLGDNMWTAVAPGGALAKASSEHFKSAHLSITVIAKGCRLTALACAEAYESGMIHGALSGMDREKRDSILSGYPIERWLSRARTDARTSDERSRLAGLEEARAKRNKKAALTASTEG